VPLRRRLRQIAVGLLSAVADRLLGLLQRIGLGPSRLTIAGADRAGTRGITYLPIHDPQPLSVVVPDYIDRADPTTERYVNSHSTWGKQRTQGAGIVTATDVDVSMPTGMHRWRGRAFREGLVGVEALRNPKYLATFAAMAVLGSTELSEGVLLALPWNHNFFHWLVEILPRLQMVEQVPELQEVPLLVPATAPGFVTESLRLSGFEQRVQHLEDGVYRIRTLHIPSPLSSTADVPPVALNWLDARFPQAAPAGRRIYISRGDAPIRYVAGEAQVAALLEEEHGFETVVMSSLPLDQQIRTFREASVIVGAHGAAFAHLAFAPRGATVIELFQDGHFNHCYGRMAASRGLHYGFLVCERQGLSLRVDVPALRALVSRVVEDEADRAALLASN
jgi:hypothetical protein